MPFTIQVAVFRVVVGLAPVTLFTKPDIPAELISIKLIMKHQLPPLAGRVSIKGVKNQKKTRETHAHQ
jgi:hypothetical protein